MAWMKTHEMIFTLAAKQNSTFGGVFSAARREFQTLYNTAAELTKQQNDISAYERQQSAVESTQNSLTRYQAKLDAAREALAKMGESGNASAQSIAKFQNQEAEMAFKVSETKRTLTEQTEKLDKMGSALEAAGVNTGNLDARQEELAQQLAKTKGKMDEIDSNGDFMNSASSSLAAFGSVAVAVGAEKIFQSIVDGMKECAAAATEYEAQMAAVRRTVGGSDGFLADLSDSLLEMSFTMPITAEELAGIATTAGQLGIAQENVEQFTAVMAQLATTTDLTAEDAATMLAQFANITGTTDYERLGSTVAELGDATATTASKIVDMAQGMAAAANIAGMSETDVLAISAAVGSLGINAQAGSTAMSTLIQTLYKAVEGGGEDLESFASVAGMTAREFADAWSGDPVTAMDAFIQGLNETERNGQSAIMILDELGITNVRQTKAILGLASAGDLLSNTITQANAAWNQNTALSEKADIMYETTSAKLTEMENAFTNLKIAVGNDFTPALGSLYEAGTDVLGWMADVADENPTLVTGITTATTALIGAVAAITAFNTATAVVNQLGGWSAILPAASALGPLAAVSAVLGLIVAGVQGGIEAYDEVYDSSMSLTNASREQADQIEALSAQYDELVAAGEGASEAAISLRTEIALLSAEYANNAESVEGLSVRVGSAAEQNAAFWDSYYQSMAAVTDEQERLANSTSTYEQAQQNVAALQANWRDALNELRAAEDELTAAQERQTAAWDTGIDDLGADAAVDAARKKVQLMQEAYDSATETLRNNASEMQLLSTEINNMSEAQGEANDVLTASGQTYEEIEAYLSDLAVAYTEAYDAVLESFRGQFDLFDTAPEIVAADVGSMIAALDSQAAYWEAYGENLETLNAKITALADTGYDTSSIEAYISAVNDGSEQGAALIAALASANETDLQSIGESYATVQAAQEDTADKAAEMESGFAAAVDAMAQAMADGQADISAYMDQLAADMDKAAEAGAAGSSTAQSYINSIMAKASAAYAAGQNLANQAKAGMQSVGVSVSAYASGTESAAPGWAWVGEAGPELMRMHGGEQILNHEQSESLMRQMEQAEAYAEDQDRMRDYNISQQPIEMDYTPSGTTVELTVAPVFNVTNNGGDMRDYDDDFVGMITEAVEDALDRISVDRRRSAYT